MIERRVFSAVIVLMLATLACGLPSIDSLTGGSASTLQAAASLVPGLLTETPDLGLLLAESTPTPFDLEQPTATVAFEAAPAAKAASALTVDQLQNGQYKLIGASDGRTVQLAAGAFQQGADTSAADYLSVRLGPLVAFGDLNGDGAGDAVVTLFENYGGTGTFASVAAVLDQGGTAVHAASYLIDDRPVLNGLTVQDGTIRVDALIHGPSDPMCCAAFPVQVWYRLSGDRLLLVRQTSQTEGGQERSITIQSPAAGSAVSGAVTISGSVTIAPFENNLSYAVFGSAGPDPVSQGGLPVNAPDPAAGGTFDLALDFASLGVTGPVRVEVSDLSAADGSILALETIFLTVQ